MKRRNFIKTAGLGVLAGFAAPAAQAAKPVVPATPGKIRAYPVLMNPEADSVSVVWLSEGDCRGVVEYGPAPDKLVNRVTAGRDGFATNDTIHRARLIGLPKGEPVHYRVITTKTPRDAAGTLDTSATYAFRLPAADAKEIRLVQINDTHENLPVIDRLLARIGELRPDFFIWNGDVFNMTGNAEHVIKHLFMPVDRPYAATIPMVFSRGNHDCRGSSSYDIPNYIGMPADRLYYAFRQGPAAFVVMDTGEDKPDAGLWSFCSFEQDQDRQARWLESEMDREEIRSAPVKVAVLHIPFWTKNYNSFAQCRIKWLPTMEKKGINLCMSGHIHTYEYLAPGEICKHREGDPFTKVTIPQIVGGGPSAGSSRLIHMKVSAGKIEIETENIDRKVIDRRTLTC